jgi:hypothetical protein
MESEQNSDVSDVSQRLYESISENEFLRESYSSMAAALLELEDKGWAPLNAASESDRFSLQHIQQASRHIREVAEGNPLLKRGSSLRSSYVFGRGVSFSEQPPRIAKIMLDAQNQDVLFSAEAQVINERSHFTDGQFFVLGNSITKKFQRIPFTQISGIVTDPDDAETIRYYRRSWSRVIQNLETNSVSTQLMNVWYPTDTYEPTGGRFATTIQGQPVDTKSRMFASRVNRRAGHIWGIPDAFSAVAWAYAYNEYLKDGSRMLKALSMFAWQLKSKTKTSATNAAATIANSSRVASTAVMGNDMELSSMPRANSVDLTNGRPLGSMVASALEVSVVALLSDPGSSGAYGTAQTLDAPTVKAMEARQAVWTQFYFRVMKFLGAKIETLEINWPKIETEPSQRMMQALALAKETNAIWEDEYRAAVIETLDIAKLHDAQPPVQTPVAKSAPATSSAVPSQGNSGAVGSMQDNGNDVRPADNKPIA